MKILIVNTHDCGGAANACIRLHTGLLQQGVDSKLLLLHKQKSIEASYAFEKPEIKVSVFRKFVHKVQRKVFRKLGLSVPKQKGTKQEQFLKSRSKGLESFSFPETPYDITKSPLYKEADIINLHWVAGFLDFESFFKKNTKPVIWTLHDMNPFTGGEHYEELFIGMASNGHPLVRVIKDSEKNLFNAILVKKIKALKNVPNLTIVAPSKWLLEESLKSKPFHKYQSKHIPYGLDSKNFELLDQAKSRIELGLPLDKKIILFVAESIDNKRKGFQFLMHAINQLNDNNLLLCAVGKPSKEIDEHKNIRHLGFVNDYRKLSCCYTAANVFVIPSLMDNLPNTVLESLMCGTPVIGFDIGGIPDMIEPGFNGLICPEITCESLTTTMNIFFSKNWDFDSMAIRNDCISKYSQEIQAHAYKKLYHDLLNNQHNLQT